MSNSTFLYGISVLVSFIACFLKGFQHKNVIGNHQRSVFATAYLMAFCDFASVSLIVRGGWIIAITSGTGAAFGMITAIKLHNRIYQTKN